MSATSTPYKAIRIRRHFDTVIAKMEGLSGGEMSEILQMCSQDVVDSPQGKNK